MIADERVLAIFEGAFEFDDIRIRVDVPERLAPSNLGLRDVKSSSGPKDHYLDDIAIQAFVLPGRGRCRFLDQADPCEHQLRAWASRYLLAGVFRPF